MKRARTAARLGLYAGLLLLNGCLFTVTWMPDGKRLAYFDSGSVWMVGLEGNKTRIYDAPGLDDPYLVASPKGNRLALLGKRNGATTLAIMDDAGCVLWSDSLTGGDYVLMPFCWSPDGDRCLATSVQDGRIKLALVSPGARVPRMIETDGDTARFSSASDILVFHTRPDGRSFVDRLDVKGRLKQSLPWQMPADIEDVEVQLLSGDGSQLWLKGKKEGKEISRLVSREGKILHESAGEIAALGPDPASCVIRDGGFILASAGGGTTSLTRFYNLLLKEELAAHIADPARAETRFDESGVVFFPVFSPDGKSFALHAEHGLYIADLNRGGLRLLAKPQAETPPAK